MNESTYDDMIAKAIQLVQHQGTLQLSVLGTHKNFEDDRINIQAFISGGVDLLIKHINGSFILEIWKGIVIIHSGDHLLIYEHLNKIFQCWHSASDVLRTKMK